MDYRYINGKYVFNNVRNVYFDLTIEEVVEMRKTLQDIERIFSPQRLDSLTTAGPDRA